MAGREAEAQPRGGMLMKKIALITGGSRGIGLGIARCLAVENCDLAVAGVREEKQAAAALEELRSAGAEVLYCRADVSDAGVRNRLLEAVKTRFGRLDVLVNNAGVAPAERADITEATEESFERVLRINLQGPYFLTQSAARWMIEQRTNNKTFAGCIINVTSVSAVAASVNRGEYCISKAGLSMATKLWATRLAEYGIAVYEIRPGIVRTDMTAAVQEKYDRLLEQGLCLESRWGSPEDVGKAAAALVRGDLPYSTGQVVTIDGGMSVPRL
jgi:NAD(P)-dependent dehydrogenase (short-subunit alcohol dehydrogenase family)